MSSQLSITSYGSGEDVVLLHGWGMNSAVWSNVVKQLADRFRLHCIDLPGHGKSFIEVEPYDLETITRRIFDRLSDKLNGPANWIGWSLGGMVSSQLAAAYPQLLKRLVLIATNLRFSQCHDWPWAMQAKVLQGFADNLQQDYKTTLQRFLSLQVMGEPNSRETLRELKKSVLDANQPSLSALQGGLQILQHADLREAARNITAPVMLLAGDKDRLVPPDAIAKIAAYFPQADYHILTNAGHAPFISQQGEVLTLIEDFFIHV